MGSRESPLVTKPPRRLRSTRWANSRPYPNVPLAARIGFRRRNAPILTLRSTAPAELTSCKRITRTSSYPFAKSGSVADKAAFRFKVNTANGEDDRVLIFHEDGVSRNLARCSRDI